MRTFGVRWAYHRARRAINGLRGSGVILLYHRVAEVPRDPFALALPPARFDEHLQMLRRRAQVMPLAEMEQAMQDRRLPRRAVAVTFDDGYADNLHNARPLLERHDIPATVFVSSGYVGQNREFWWDELQRHVLADDGTGDMGRYLQLHGRLKQATASEREQMLRRLAGGDAVPARHTHRPLTIEELRRLGEADLVEIGAHTVSHSSLAALPPPEQQRELVESRRQLECWLDRPVRRFSYPFGSRGDYNAESPRLAREAGYHSACSAWVGPVRHGGDLYQLPRLDVGQDDAETLERRIDGVLRD